MPYLRALEVCSRKGAIQIHVYYYLYPVGGLERGHLDICSQINCYELNSRYRILQDEC